MDFIRSFQKNYLTVINKKTFYLHYLDKYHLLDTIVNKKLEELEEICE